MRPETRTHLADVRAAAREIQEIGGLSGEGYLTSRRDALAVERLFEVLGEALIRVRMAEPDVLDRIADAVAIIGMRNVIAHGYDAIDPARIAATIEKRLPVLIDELDRMLGQG